eukprot:Skav215293  [mRNA]  locus=scaffold2522:227637:228764:- [translate_table: standard]
MTWFCRSCSANNRPQQEHCKSCRSHWSEVWRPSRRQRSQSQKDKHGKKAQQPKEPKGNKDRDKPPPKSGGTKEALEAMFPESLPWVPTTPQARNVPRRVETADMQGNSNPVQLGLPPQPTLDPPPQPPVRPNKGTLSVDEQKMLESLRGLQQLKVELTPDMIQKLEELESQISQEKPALSHAQVNKLHKLKNQLQSSAKRIQALDTEWGQFIQVIMDRVFQHAQCYQQRRTQLLDAHALRQLELRQVKQSITQASLHMAQHEVEEDIPDAVDFAAQLQELQRLGQVQTPHVQFLDDDNDEEEDDDVMEELEPEELDGQESVELAETPKPGKKAQPTPHTTFRNAPSPTKVANQNLKTKTTKAGEHKTVASRHGDS